MLPPAIDLSSQQSCSLDGVSADVCLVKAIPNSIKFQCCAEAARGADLVSHEATYDFRNQKKARRAQHSTATMAGSFCRRIQADWLFLTHFSGRYEGLRAAARGGNTRGGPSRTPFTNVSTHADQKSIEWESHCEAEGFNSKILETNQGKKVLHERDCSEMLCSCCQADFQITLNS